MTKEIVELTKAIINPTGALRLADIDILPAGKNANITVRSIRVYRWVAAGSTGQIYEGKTKNGTRVAIKIMVCSTRALDEFHPNFCAEREIQCAEGARMAYLNKDSNVVRLLAHGPLASLNLSEEFHASKNIGDALIYEWCNAGDLDLLVENCLKSRFLLPEGLIWKWLIEIVSVSCLLSVPLLENGKFICDVIHDDIKPDNIFLTFGDSNPAKSWPSIKVGDFGFAQPVTSNLGYMKTGTGVAPYTSPQWPIKSVKTELWEFVHCIYMVCTMFAPAIPRDKPLGNPHNDPFRMLERYSKRQYEQHQSDVEVWRIPAYYSNELQWFFEWALNADLDARPTPIEVEAALLEINAPARAEKFVPLPVGLFKDYASCKNR